MRAIDADRLQKQFDEKSTNPNYRVNMHNIKSIISNAPTVEAIPKEKMIEMYDKIVKTSYDTAESYPKHKGIMLYEAQMIIDIMKEYLFKENNDGNNTGKCGRRWE